MREAIIIFVKNPVKGKVKTRLAAEIGDDKALEVYISLLEHTKKITCALKADKFLFYDQYINEEDEWNRAVFQKHLQHGDDLGARMKSGFTSIFRKGYQSVIIIGSDCFELTTEIIEQAFLEMKEKDFIVGPAKDGGYYLLGMRQMEEDVFKNIEWSTSSVFEKTIKNISKLNKTYSVLPVLSDVDRLNDLYQE